MRGQCRRQASVGASGKPAGVTARPSLHIVEQSAEQRLRVLFAREDALKAELAAVREEQRIARNDYADERRLLIRPGLEALRKVLGR